MVMVGMVTISRCVPLCLTCGICCHPEGRGASQDAHPSGHSYHPEVRVLHSSQNFGKPIWFADTLGRHQGPLQARQVPYHIQRHKLI